MKPAAEQYNEISPVRMPICTKEALAAGTVAQDVRPISYERRGHHRTTVTANDEVESKLDTSARFIRYFYGQAMSAR